MEDVFSLSLFSGKIYKWCFFRGIMTLHCAVQYFEPDGSFGYVMGVDRCMQIGPKNLEWTIVGKVDKSFLGENTIGLVAGGFSLQNPQVVYDPENYILSVLKEMTLLEAKIGDLAKQFEDIHPGKNYLHTALVGSSYHVLLAQQTNGGVELYKINSKGDRPHTATLIDSMTPREYASATATSFFFSPIPDPTSPKQVIISARLTFEQALETFKLTMNYPIEQLRGPQYAGYDPMECTVYQVSPREIKKLETT